MKVGFIGLGNVGGKLAKSLLRNEFDLTVRDLDKDITKSFLDLGARVANSAKELAEQVDLIITCLPSPQFLERSLEELLIFLTVHQISQCPLILDPL